MTNQADDTISLRRRRRVLRECSAVCATSDREAVALGPEWG